MVSTAFTFWFLDEFYQIFWMIPIMGFCQLALFGGYAIYFPELFPTRLRSTGTSFCYNVGRLVAAAGPSVLGLLTSQVFGGYHEPMRYAGVAMCSVFFLGLLALPFAPETRGSRCRSEKIHIIQIFKSVCRADPTSAFRVAKDYGPVLIASTSGGWPRSYARNPACLPGHPTSTMTAGLDFKIP